MSYLTCDICEGKITIRSGGVAVCEVCGMEHSKERLLEKTQELRTQSTSLVTSSSLAAQSNINQTNIATWLEMAMNAQASSNNAEAEAYATRILEVDPEHWHAWIIKGYAAGWQSTLNNLRIHETAQCYSKSLAYVPEDRRDEITEHVLKNLESLALAIIKLRGNHFGEYPVDVRAFKSNVNEVLNAVETFTTTHSLYIPNFRINVSSTIHLSCMDAFNGPITDDYRGTENRPNHYEFSAYIEQTDNCISLIEFAIELKERTIIDKTYYETLIVLENKCCSACSYSKWYDQYGTFYKKEYTLTDEAIRRRQARIQKYRDMIKQVIAEVEQQRIAQEKLAEEHRIAENNAFWLTHKTQKEELIQEQDKLHVLYIQAKADYSIKEQSFIQKRLIGIEQILSADYFSFQSLPSAALEILASQQEWHQQHINVREASLAETKIRMQERDSIRQQIAEQDVIIAQNPGFFGEPARIRKQAKQTKVTLQSQLSAYNDLG